MLQKKKIENINESKTVLKPRINEEIRKRIRLIWYDSRLMLPRDLFDRMRKDFGTKISQKLVKIS